MENRFTLSLPQTAQLQKILTANVLNVGRMNVMVLGVHLLTWIFVGLTVRSLWESGAQSEAVAVALLPAGLYAAIALLVFMIGIAYIKRRYARAGFSDSGWMLSEQILAATDEGVTINARFGSVRLVWTGLTGVLQDDHHYYLLIEPCQGFMVPKHAIKDTTVQAKLAALASLSKA